MKYFSIILLLCSLFIISCSGPGSSADAQSKPVSQFHMAGLCDLLIDKSGVYHALFQETPAIGKPKFIYYSSSTNKGASWSTPITVSNDGHGNGSGYPRIIQDGKGIIYAIWKRYGNTATEYPVPDPLLDGPGGTVVGTIFYKVLNGGTWSAPVQLNEVEATQVSWFATVAANGVVFVVWSQDNPATLPMSRQNPRFADYVRGASLNGTSHSAYGDLTKPIQPAPGQSFPATQEGKWNLDGYFDKAGVLHFIYSIVDEKGVERIVYNVGSTATTVYSYPAYAATNSFAKPPRLLFDEKGNDHLIFLPSPATLESEQVWDMNLTTKAAPNLLASIQKPGVTISAVQAKQGPNGDMAVTFEVVPQSGNAEGYGAFYENGTWKNVGLTNNASKEKFFYKDFGVVNGWHTIASHDTRYNSKFMSVAYDAAGHKSLLMNLEAYAVGYGIANPDILFMNLDK